MSYLLNNNIYILKLLQNNTKYENNNNINDDRCYFLNNCINKEKINNFIHFTDYYKYMISYYLFIIRNGILYDNNTTFNEIIKTEMQFYYPIYSNNYYLYKEIVKVLFFILLESIYISATK